MGGITAPVCGSGTEPTCTALVSNSRSWLSDMRSAPFRSRAALARRAPLNTTRWAAAGPALAVSCDREGRGGRARGREGWGGREGRGGRAAGREAGLGPRSARAAAGGQVVEDVGAGHDPDGPAVLGDQHGGRATLGEQLERVLDGLVLLHRGQGASITSTTCASSTSGLW